MIESIFLRTIDANGVEIDVARASGGSHVAIYVGPFSLQIDVWDLSSLIRALAFVTSGTMGVLPPIALSCGAELHIGTNPHEDHVWIVYAVAHLRISCDTATKLLAALSEARHDIDRRAAAALSGGVPKTC